MFVEMFFFSDSWWLHFPLGFSTEKVAKQLNRRLLWSLLANFLLIPLRLCQQRHRQLTLLWEQWAITASQCEALPKWETLRSSGGMTDGFQRDEEGRKKQHSHVKFPIHCWGSQVGCCAFHHQAAGDGSQSGARCSTPPPAGRNHLYACYAWCRGWQTHTEIKKHKPVVSQDKMKQILRVLQISNIRQFTIKFARWRCVDHSKNQASTGPKQESIACDSSVCTLVITSQKYLPFTLSNSNQYNSQQ